MENDSKKVSFWEQYLGVDLRSLALMRVFASFVILFDLLVRFSYLSAHYGIGSVYPPELMGHIGQGQTKWPFLAHVIETLPHFPLIVFAVALLSVFLVLIGYKTRISTAVAWLCILTIQNMNPLILHGGDDMQRLILLLGIFLPWGEYFSVDRALKYGGASPPRRAVSPWTFALLLQISLIYLCAAFEKTIGMPWQDGSAVYYALSSYYATSVGMYFLNFPPLLTFLTYGVRFFQMSIIFLIFFPIANKVSRTIAMVLLMLMHLSFTVFLYLASFSWIAIAFVSALMPSEFWDFMQKRLTKTFGGLKIYYDGDCGFCKKSVYLIRIFLLLPSAEIEIAQSNIDVYEDMKKYDSWVIQRDDGTRSFEFGAAITLIAHSPVLFPLTPLLRLPWIRSVGDRAYRFVATHRSRVCTPSPKGFIMPTRVARSFRIASNIVAAAFIITIVVWNYGNFYKISIPPEFKQLVRTLGVDQRWKMFAPVPVSYNGWNIIDGTLESGEHVNVFDPTQPLSMTRPSVTHVAYGNMRWLKYFEAMDRSPFVFYRPYLAAYFCRSWNETHSERNRLARVDITFVRAPTLPNYLLASTTRYVLTSTTCDILPVKN